MPCLVIGDKERQDIKGVSLGTSRGSLPELLHALQRRLVVALGLDWFQVHCYTIVASIRSYAARNQIMLRIK